MTSSPSLQNTLKTKKEVIDHFLENNLNSQSPRLDEAIRYSVLSPGKRIRGILCLLGYEIISKTESMAVLPMAAGIECIHTMSLIHDDLPCMDDDDLRRGQLSCHKQFDEATALLAGDGLLIEGLRLCLQADIPSDRRVLVTQEICQAIGTDGMTAGQMIDLESTDISESLSLDELERLHSLKTGAFLRASIVSGAIAAGADSGELEALSVYGASIGLAFQIADDLLDIEGETSALGKTAGKDQAQNKSTYPGLIGVDSARNKAKELIEQAKQSLLVVGIDSQALLDLADYVVFRKG